MNTARTIQINVRLPREASKNLDSLAKLTKTKRINLAQRMLENGIVLERRNIALQLYRDGEVTKSRAAEIAGISIWEIDDLITASHTVTPMSVEDAVSEVRRVVASVAVIGAKSRNKNRKRP